MLKLVRQLSRDDHAVTAVEYGLIAALVVIAMIAGVALLAGESTSVWTRTLERTSEATASGRN